MSVALREDRMTKARERLGDLKRLQEAGLICRQGDFYPSVHYPPITMYPPITEEELFRGYVNPEDGLFDVYAHLPFCQQRCLFCHYPVKFGEQHEEKERYLASLEKEMDLYMRRLGLERIHARSILVGGGTPTYLTPAQLDRFLEYFVRRLDMSACTQFNYDVDPGSLVGSEGHERLRIMRAHGVDRLTIGVQSLNEDILRLMNRPHDVQTALQAIANSREMGFQVNIEFIFGHPGETIENWTEAMEQAVTLDVEEIQLYRLKVEAYGDFQGPIKKYKELHPDEVPSTDDTLLMKQLAIEILAEHGYHENLRRVFTRRREHYSHYAHNQCCMLYDEIGLGLTAFSSLRDRFGLNTQYFDEYYAKIEAGQLPVNRGLVRSREEEMRWAIILPLKNRDVWKPTFEKLTGRSLNDVFRRKIERLKAFGLVVEDETSIVLTDLGAYFADEVAEQFNDAKYKPFPRSEYAEGPLNPYVDCDP
jgi:oxygen-independent coproporphyrinogen-3 oxidase